MISLLIFMLLLVMAGCVIGYELGVRAGGSAQQRGARAEHRRGRARGRGGNPTIHVPHRQRVRTRWPSAPGADRFP